MEQVYKDHRIEISPSLATGGDGWFVRIFIYYQDNGTTMLVTFSLDQKFTSYDGAVNDGFAAARDWVNREVANK